MCVSNTMSPLITVYIPTHNRRALLERAISSVFSQTYDNLEIIVVDDGSKDETQHYLQTIEVPAGRTMISFRNEIPIGAPKSRNIAINHAKGEFITGCDDDDYFLPNRVSLFFEEWQRLNKDGQSRSALFSNFEILRKANKAQTNFPKLVELKDLQSKNHIGNQIFTLVETMRRAGGFDPDMPAWQDYEFWYRIVKLCGPMQRIDSVSYVADETHDMQRISTASKDRIFKAYSAFSHKHLGSLGPLAAKRLYLNYLEYPQISLDFNSIRPALSPKLILPILNIVARKMYRAYSYK